jgi:hypothetical protein
LPEARGERQPQQECEEDLDAGLGDAHLLEELDEIAVAPLEVGLVPFDLSDIWIHDERNVLPAQHRLKPLAPAGISCRAGVGSGERPGVGVERRLPAEVGVENPRSGLDPPGTDEVDERRHRLAFVDGIGDDPLEAST